MTSLLKPPVGGEASTASVVPVLLRLIQELSAVRLKLPSDLSSPDHRMLVLKMIEVRPFSFVIFFMIFFFFLRDFIFKKTLFEKVVLSDDVFFFLRETLFSRKLYFFKKFNIKNKAKFYFALEMRFRRKKCYFYVLIDCFLKLLPTNIGS